MVALMAFSVEDSKNNMAKAFLTIINGPEEGRTVTFDTDQIVSIGRKETNCFQIQDEIASRFHCEIFFEDNIWKVRDLASRNGTSVNGDNIFGATPLFDGQQLHLGKTRLLFTVGDQSPSGSPSERLLCASREPNELCELNLLREIESCGKVFENASNAPMPFDDTQNTCNWDNPLEELSSVAEERERFREIFKWGWPNSLPTLIDLLKTDPHGPHWTEFWRIYSPVVYYFCQRRNLQHHDILDISQNALLQMRRSLHNFDFKKGRFRGWFAMIIRREISKFRNARLQDGKSIEVGQISEEVEIEDDRSDWDREFHLHAMEVAIARLKMELAPDDIVILEKVLVQGQKPSLIASDVGIEPASISRKKYKILQRLKEVVLRISEPEGYLRF